MLWVVVFAAIALAGLVMVVCYGVWLVHKGSDLMSEVTVVAQRAAQLADLIGQIKPPVRAWDPSTFGDLVEAGTNDDQDKAT